MPNPGNDGTASHVEEPINASVTDEQLMAAFERGSSDAFTALFDRYRQPLFGFFRRRITDPSIAEELTQETFIAVLRGINRYQSMSLFRTYLYAIGYRILRSYRRKAFFRSRFAAIAPPGQEPASNPSLESDLVMREALRRLDRLEREILMLREFEQLSYTEIAAVLDLPVNTVRSRLFRARSALRLLLTEPPLGSTQVKLSVTKEPA